MARVTYDMYQAFLQGIRRSKTSIVDPEYFNTFINEVVIGLFDESQSFLDANQKLKDLYAYYMVTLDSMPNKPLYRLTTSTEENVTVFPFPVKTHNNQDVEYYYNSFSKQSYPQLLRFRKMWVSTVNPTVRNPSYNWKKVIPMHSDYENRFMDNTFLKPGSGNDVYYLKEEDGGSLNDSGRVIKVLGISDATLAKLEYIRKPQEIFFDKANFNDEPTNTSHTPGQGCVPPDFDREQVKIVIDYAIEKYMVRVHGAKQS